MTIITRRQALVLVIVMGLLAMSLALSWDVFIDRDQTVSAQEAREQRDALVSSLTPGAVLYQKFSHYNPHASTPETVRETWMRLGPGASVDAEVSKTYDANGSDRRDEQRCHLLQRPGPQQVLRDARDCH